MSRTDFEKNAFYTPDEISAPLQVHISQQLNRRIATGEGAFRAELRARLQD